MIDWKAFRASLDPDELKDFDRLCRRVRHWKQIIEVADSFRPLFKGSQPQCETHWIPNCYTCSPISQLDLILKKARKALNGCRFVMRSMLIKHGVLEQPTVEATAVFIPISDRHPIDRMFTLYRSDTATRKTGKDVSDNIRLIEAYIKERF